MLADGGVYDNLGLETAWKRYRHPAGLRRRRQDPPKKHVRALWPLQLYRVMMTIDNQVRSLRKRAVIASYKQGLRSGCYWGIRTDIANYHLRDALPCPEHQTRVLADIPTRLKRLDELTQERLINWGYAASDAALRAHLHPDLPAPAGFPHPQAAVG